MKQFKMFSVLALAAFAFACSNDEDLTVPPPPPTPVDTVLFGTLTANKTLTSDKTWILKGYVYVPNGVTLTIQPGTLILSDVAEKGALCIERGGKIDANGTATQPIVFTSGKPSGQRAPGDWGGIVILGRAKTNRSSTPVIEGGLDRPYGGTDDADNSGIMRYVRIEYAGIAAFANSEVNALTLGGVGSGTTIEYVQTSYANDDAFEFFGGKVNAKYLVAAYTADDDFDFDFGYTGKIQYAVSLRDPAFVDGGDAGNGIECDNDNPPTTSGPFTRPVLSNITFVGPNNASGTAANHNYANRFRRNTRFVLRNSILMGYQKGGFSIEQDSTASYYSQDLSVFNDNLVHAIASPYRSGSSLITGAQMQAKAEGNGCITYANASDINLEAPFNLTAPNFLPKAGSPALTGAKYDGDLDAFFTTGAYRGAFGTTNWLNGWTRFYTNGQ
ncbi:MAG: hypothetical protein MUE58_03390 [Chitinophagaceae bacterium]|nr:hypothetical protein [Chitinophagaceae bacterium]